MNQQEKEQLVGVEVNLDTPEAFLLCKETLTRMGVSNTTTNTLYQTAHILHKRGKYYICHFKELFILDGKHSTITEEDLQRRNRIVKCLVDWGLVKVDTSGLTIAPISSIKIIPFKKKHEWNLVPKYQLGNSKTH